MDSDGITWYPMCSIEKYSAAQVARARSRLGPGLTGDALRAMFDSGPEGGILFARGNGTTVAGVANLALLLTGVGGHPLAPGRTVFGVGGDAAGFSREHASLSPAAGEKPGQSWYRPMDFGYPVVSRPGVIEGQATFSEAEACFEWREWCWGTGPGQAAAHYALRGCYGGEQPVMLNRKSHPAGYGSKEPGVAWVFRAEITLS